MLSSSPIPEMVPVRAGAISGRYIMDWNKDSVADANFAKIDILSLPVLDQLEEALDLIEAKEGHRPDLGRIRPDDPAVYDMIGQGKSKGVFLLQSPAQLKMGQRLRSRNLLDLAYQVAPSAPASASRAAPCPSSWSGTAMGRRGSTTTPWRSGHWSGGTESSSGRSRWCSSSWTWPE